MKSRKKNVYWWKKVTSTVAKKANAVNTGKMYWESGVVKSVNQNAPPPLNEGTFSTMFDIYNKECQLNFPQTVNH